MIRVPGVYRPQADSLLLAGALREAGLPPGLRVADLGTGCGLLAMVAAELGAREVVAVDCSRRAVLSTALNAWVRGAPVRACRGDLSRPGVWGRFDVVLANPPYVPDPGEAPPAGAERAWAAGPEGRRCLDPLCARAGSLLTEAGTLLLVQSTVAGDEDTVARLRATGLKASVVARQRVPFGPVLRAQATYLVERGLAAPGQRDEELVVIRADRAQRPS